MVFFWIFIIIVLNLIFKLNNKIEDWRFKRHVIKMEEKEKLEQRKIREQNHYYYLETLHLIKNQLKEHSYVFDINKIKETIHILSQNKYLEDSSELSERVFGDITVFYEKHSLLLQLYFPGPDKRYNPNILYFEGEDLEHYIIELFNCYTNYSFQLKKFSGSIIKRKSFEFHISYVISSSYSYISLGKYDVSTIRNEQNYLRLIKRLIELNVIYRIFYRNKQLNEEISTLVP